MGNAVELFLTTPIGYVSMLWRMAHPSGFIFGLTSWVGVIGLLAGLVMGFDRGLRTLLWFALSPLLSQMFVVVAGVLFGRLGHDAAQPMVWSFLAVQLALLAFLTYRHWANRAPALALATFGLSYAFFSAFLAGMLFTNTWL